MSTVFPPSRSELLRELASMLLDDHIEGRWPLPSPGYTDDGRHRPLGSTTSFDRSHRRPYGFRAPAEWLAFGVLTSGTARHLDTDDVAAIDVRVVYFLDRRGLEVSLAKAGDGAAPMLVDVIGPPTVIGRVPDTCRRVLGLPTPPPDRDPQLLWALDWLDRVLIEVLGRDLDSAPLDWPAIEQLYRGRPSNVARGRSFDASGAAGQLDLGPLTRTMPSGWTTACSVRQASRRTSMCAMSSPIWPSCYPAKHGTSSWPGCTSITSCDCQLPLTASTVSGADSFVVVGDGLRRVCLCFGLCLGNIAVGHHRFERCFEGRAEPEVITDERSSPADGRFRRGQLVERNFEAGSLGPELLHLGRLGRR
jgi:hypothetical protein